MTYRDWFKNILISLDQFGNVVGRFFGLGSGNPDETISSYWGRKRREGSKAAKVGCKILDVVEDALGGPKDKDHCEESIEFKDGKPDPHHLKEKE